MKKIFVFLLLLLINFNISNANQKTLKLWTFWKQDWLQPGIDNFLKNNPDYKIEYQQLSWSNGKDKITTAFAGGAEPDILELGSTWMAEFIGYDALAELNKETYQSYFISGFDAAVKNDKLYGLPLFGSVNIFYYNKDLFKRAGFDNPPKNWDELLEISKKIKLLADDIFGFSIKYSDKDPTTWQKFIPFIWTNGGKIINDEHNKILIYSQENLETFEYIKELAKYSIIARQDAVRQAFYLGKLGIILDGPGLELEKKAPKLNVGMFLMPDVNPAKKGVNFTGVNYLAISEKCKDKKKAQELIHSIIQNNQISIKINTLLPFEKTAIAQYLKIYQNNEFYFEQLKNSKASPVYKNWEPLMYSLNFALGSILLNQVSSHYALKRAEKEMTDIVLSDLVEYGKKINLNFLITVIVIVSLIFTIYLIIKIREKSILLMLAPWLVWFLVLNLYPILFSLFVSFTNYNPLMLHQTIRFIGIDNFVNLLKDQKFLNAIINTLIFSVLNIPVTTILALITAVFLNENIPFKKIFRAAYFFPVITSIIVIAMIFNFIYAPFGPLNALLKHFNIERIDFLNEPSLAMLSIALMSVWASFGYYMLLLLAALQSIPDELYESSALDGATPLKNFWHITLPLLKPMILFVLVISTIRSMQVFSEMFVMTGGGPLEKTTTIVYYLYNYGFSQYKMGYASAAAYILFAIILILSIIQMKVLKSDNN